MYTINRYTVAVPFIGHVYLYFWLKILNSWVWLIDPSKTFVYLSMVVKATVTCPHNGTFIV